MAKTTHDIGPLPRAELSPAEIPGAIRKLDRRLEELTKRAQEPYHPETDSNDARLISNSINATMEEIFGVGTADAKDFKIYPNWFWINRYGHRFKKGMPHSDLELSRQRKSSNQLL